MSVEQVGDTQTKLRLKLKTGIDMSAGTGEVPASQKIYYWNPSNTNSPLLNTNRDGDWDATILSGSETDGIVYYDLTLSDPMARGTWTFRAAITYSDSRVVYTKQVKMVVGD